MKAVIDHKLYDTETAQKIVSIDNGLSCRDFRHCRGALYRTRAGRYFVAGTGGPMSRFSHATSDGCRSGGSAIEPISRDEAQAIAEEHGLEPDMFATHGLDAEEA